jgi:ribulose-phosphate 3-epimerase
VAWPEGIRVEPSILSADFGAFRAEVVELLDAGARAFHVDVMDGHFVPVITFGARVVASIADVVHERDGVLDVHLMVESPERLLADFAKAGADSCTVHVETCPHLHQTIATLHELGLRAGVTLNPATPTAALIEAARYADVLLCMSVNPGWGGQRFIEASLERLGAMRRLLRPGMGLEVDGGVGPATIEGCVRAGANLLVAGSAIYEQPSPGEAYAALLAQARAAAGVPA